MYKIYCTPKNDHPFLLLGTLRTVFTHTETRTRVHNPYPPHPPHLLMDNLKET